MRFVDRTLFPLPKFMESPEWTELCGVVADTHDIATGGKRGKQMVVRFEDLFSRFRDEAVEAVPPEYSSELILLPFFDRQG